MRPWSTSHCHLLPGIDDEPPEMEAHGRASSRRLGEGVERSAARRTSGMTIRAWFRASWHSGARRFATSSNGGTWT